MKKLFLILTCIFGCITSTLRSQNNPLIIEIIVLPPYSTNAIDYFNSPTQTAVTIINPSGNTYNTFFAGSITNLSTQQSVTIRNDILPPVPPLSIEPGVKILNGNELAQYVSPSSLQYIGLSEQDAINGNLPEGEYQICLQLYDFDNLQLRSQPEPAGCSNIFNIQFVQPPFLIAPACSSEVSYLPVQNIVFSWVPPPLGLLQGSLLSYEFRLIEVPQGMTAVHAMQAVTTPVALENTLFNTFLYSSLNPQLIPGRLYAWRVKVTDLNNNVLFSNNGESEICEFRYGLPDPMLTPLSVTIAFPTPGSRNPLKSLPIIAKYEPVDSLYRGIRTVNEISSIGGNIDLFEQQIIWPNGPDLFLQQQLGALPSLEQLQHIRVSKNPSLPQESVYSSSGVEYSIRNSMEFNLHNSNSVYAEVNSTFSNGFYKPILNEPRLDTVYLKQNRIRFRFTTSDTTLANVLQSKLLPSKEIIVSTMGNSAQWCNATVFERYRLEISKSLQFDSIISRNTGLFQLNEVIHPNTNIQLLKRRIYGEINTELSIPDTGTYYWRVCWLSNPLDSLSAPYEISLPEKFRIIGLPVADSARSACIAGCDASPIADRTAVNTLQIGQKIKVGKFTMEIQSIELNNLEANGLGLISVPFMNTIMKVSFSNIKVNAKQEMFSGNVVARMDTTGFMPNIPGLGKLTVNNQEELFEYLKRNRYTSVFDPTIPMGLPLGLDKMIDGERYLIAIVGMSFQPERATLSAAVSIPMPFLPPKSSNGKTQQLGLGASNLCFHPYGLTGIGIASLYLNDPLEFDYAPGQYIKFLAANLDASSGMVADSGTYVSWDCDGFRAIHVKGEISFSKDLFTRPNEYLPDSTAENDIDAETDPSKVKARFKFNAKRSGNWLTSIDMDPFCIHGVKDWNFVVKEATLDFSDLENPSNLIFPNNYAGDRSIYWNGFHLKQVKVGLPKELRPRFPQNEALNSTDKDSVLRDRIIVDLNDLLIDRTGISGKITSYNLVSLKDGDINGWSFSIDTLNVEFISNSFTKGGFNGNLLTPLTPTEFKYKTILSQSENNSGLKFNFNVKAKDNIVVPIWAATMKLEETSRFKIEADNGGFKPELTLNGSVDIIQNIGNKVDVRFAGVRFQNLKLQTTEPLLSCTAFSFSSPDKFMAGFPVSVSNVRLGSQENHGLFSWDDTPGLRQVLNFDLFVNFTGENNSFGGSTTLGILGRFDSGTILTGGDEFPSLKLTGIDVKTIDIRGDLGFVSFKGFANFYENVADYGKGFIGGIDATFLKCINVSVIGCFGEINNMRYWYMDAMAKFTPGINLSIPAIPPVPIPIDLYGFGGGAFYKMSLASSPPSKDSALENKTPDNVPSPGTTLSGLRLVPNPNAFFGLMGTVVLGSSGGGQAFNCDLTIAADLTNGGGINSIGFSGSGYFMSKVFERDFTSVSADLTMVMNFPTVEFNANYSLMVNVPYLIEGNKNFNSKLAGDGFMFFNRDKWQIISGTPNNRNALKLARSFDLSSYLMVGEDLPPAPQPDSKFLDASEGLTYNANRGSSISTGKGFAFGASLKTKYNERFFAFRTNLDAGLGFDISLLNMGSSQCDGMAPGEQMGLNGWYAHGSCWAYFDGGIYIDGGVLGELDIIESTFAAIIEGGFPNPVWASGRVSLRYSLLNGLIEGNCPFQFKIGESCEPIPETPIAGLRMISELSPANGQTDVDCRSLPNAVFNIDLNKEINFRGVNSAGNTVNRKFRFLIEEYTLSSDRGLVPRNISENMEGSQAMLLPLQMLSPNTNYTLRIKVIAEERVSGTWRAARKADNTLISESLTSSFRTGALPQTITDNDIKFSYPFNRQRYFCKKQCENALIELKQSNWGHLFNASAKDIPGGHLRTFIAQFEPNGGGDKLESNVSYSGTSITFEIPTALSKNTIYRIRIIRRDIPQSNSTANAGLEAKFSDLQTLNRSYLDGQINFKERKTNGFNAIGQNEFLIYQYFFKTSNFDYIQDKLNALQVSETYREFYDPYENLVLKLNGSENFDEFEVKGYTYTVGHERFIQRSMSISDAYSTSWHTNFLNTRIYNLYSRLISNNYTSRRFARMNPDNIGIPPTRVSSSVLTDRPISDSEINPTLRSNSLPWINELLQIQTPANLGLQIQNPIIGNNLQTITQQPLFNQPSSTNITLILETSEWARKDYDHLRATIALLRQNNASLNGIDQITRNMITQFENSAFRNMDSGNYKVNFNSINPTRCNGASTNNTVVKSFNYNSTSIFQLLQLITF